MVAIHLSLSIVMESKLRALSKSQNWPAGPVILTMKNAFFQEFLVKHHFLCASYLGSD